MDAVTLIFFGVFVGVFAVIIVTALRADRKTRAEFDALVQAQGWTVERTRAGRQQLVTIQPASGDWVLRIRYPRARGGGAGRSSAPGSTEFIARTPNWPGGRALFAARAPGLAEQLTGGMGAGMAGLLQNGLVRMMLSKVIPPEIMTDLDRMSPFDPPPGIELMILATEDPREGNLRAIHDAVQGWRPRRSRDIGTPTVTIGPEGTAVRLNGILSDAEDLRRFVEHSRTLAAALA